MQLRMSCWRALICFVCPLQPMAQRPLQLVNQMDHTNCTDLSGSRLRQTQTWRSHWPECKTVQEPSHQLLTTQLSLHSRAKINNLLNKFTPLCACLLISLRRAAGVYLCSLQKWGEMRKASWKASRFRDWRTSWEPDRCPLLSYCWTVCQLTGSVTQQTSINVIRYLRSFILYYWSAWSLC